MNTARETAYRVDPALWMRKVLYTKDRSTAVVGGRTILESGLSLLKEFEELPQGVFGSERAEALARIDRLYDYKTLIFADLSFDLLCRNFV